MKLSPPLPYPLRSNLWDLAAARDKAEYILPSLILPESWLDSWMVNFTRVLAKVKSTFPQVRRGEGGCWPR